MFAEIDADGSGEIDANELHNALADIGIDVDLAVVRHVIAALDFDDGGAISIMEMSSAMDAHKRKRRAFAANVLASALEAVNVRKLSIFQLFQNFDRDKSGALSRQTRDLRYGLQ